MKFYIEKPYIYFYVYSAIFYVWLKIVVNKWQFARIEDKFLRSKLRLEAGWAGLALLDKKSKKESERNLQQIDVMIFDEEEKIRKTRQDISCLEDALEEMLRIARKK